MQCLTCIFTSAADRRVGSCYLEVPLYSTGRTGICNDKIADDVSRATCCCSVGRGWGEVIGFCEPCPRNGTGRLFKNCIYCYNTAINIICCDNHIEFEFLCVYNAKENSKEFVL